MAGSHSEPEHVEPPPRVTPAQAFRELAMAYATKQQRASTPATEGGTFTTGPLQGQTYVKSHVAVQRDGEEWPQYIGRYESEWRALLTVHTRLNAELSTDDGGAS